MPTPNVATGLELLYLLDGDALDASGNSNDGTEISSPAYTSDVPSALSGVTTQSLSMDGTNKYVSSNIYTTPGDTMSVCCWAKLTSALVDHPMFGHATAGNGFSAKVESSDGHLDCLMGNQNKQTDDAFPVATWSHVCITRVSGSGNFKSYLNGVEVLSTSHNGNRNADVIYVGRWAFSHYWLGQIADFRVYNRELTSLEAAEIAAGDYSVTPPVASEQNSLRLQANLQTNLKTSL